MTNRRSVTGAPSDYVTGGKFPNAEFAADAPSAVWWAADIAIALRNAIGDRTLVSLAEDADVGRSTLYEILRGDTWPDLVTIVKLQQALEVSLWPKRPATWQPQ